MASNMRKKILLCIFCLASIFQGMYSTYFVSILTIIERMYQIQSKTAGAILSATEIGQILGSLLIAYYGGRGNKPKWISACMALSAIAALASISPHIFLLNHGPSKNIVGSASTNINPTNNQLISTSSPYPLSNHVTPGLIATSLNHNLVDLSQLCLLNNDTNPVEKLSSVQQLSQNNLGTNPSYREQQSYRLVLVIFFICLLAIGFGYTAITTLGIPFIDDIVSKEESPLYLGLTIGLKILGPALGFLLGSFCINLDLNLIGKFHGLDQINETTPSINYHLATVQPANSAWWLGLVLISLPLLILALPMYILSRMIDGTDNQADDFADITYQAAEDHDIGGSHDFQSHILGLDGVGDVSNGADLGDITSNRTCFSSGIDSSSCEVLQAGGKISPRKQYYQYSNYGRNISLEQPMLTTSDHIDKKTKLMPIDSDTFDDGAINDGNSDHENNEARRQRLPLSVSGVSATVSNLRQNNIDFTDCATSNWRSGICVVVNHFGGLESTHFTNGHDANDHDEIMGLHKCQSATQTSSSRSSIVPSVRSYVAVVNKTTRDQLQQQQQLSTISDLSSTLSRLFKNRLLLLRMVSGILHILPIAGFFTFFPKYLIEQFRITPSSASAINGLAGMLFVGLGAFLGGTVVRLFNVNSRLMTRWIASSALLYTIGMLILMNLGCPKNQTVHHNSMDYKSTDCLTSCKCLDTAYNPVCANGTTYLSPCLAGCKSYAISGDRILFDECGCSSSSPSSSSLLPLSPTPSISVNSGSSNNNSMTNLLNNTSSSMTINEDGTDNVRKQHPHDNHINLNIAIQGHCLIECDNLKWYIIIFSISTLIHASCEVGSMMLNLRCVKSDDRALALGLTTFSSSLLGTIPCSVIYGTVVDLTCVHWSSVFTNGFDGKSEKGACQAYENDSFRYYLHGVTAFVMFLAFLIDCLISRRANEVDFYDANDSRTDIRMELKKSTETI